MSLPWNRDTATGLLQRTGFGATTAEVDRAVADGRDRTIDRLLSWETISTAPLDAVLAPYGFNFTNVEDNSYEQYVALRQWWMLRMMHSPRQLEEKLTLFWHMHFATSSDKVDILALLYQQNQIFRTKGGGRFGDLLLAVSRDPAMLIWLDNDTNVKESPNENFAREVMELFTMGIGHYTQTDVTEAARAFTGWTFHPDNYQYVFDASVHDEGTKQLLGRSGNLTGEDAISIIAARAETASYMTRKLARFFLGNDPSPPLSAQLESTFTSSGGDIKQIVRTILRSEDCDASIAGRSLIKSPVEMVVSAMRMLGVSSTAEYLSEYASLSGQSLFAPPNVSGWKTGLNWFNTGSYLARMNFGNDLASSREDDAMFRWNPNALFGGASATPAQLIDAAAAKLAMRSPSGALRSGLLDYLRPAGDPLPWNDQTADEYGRGIVHLLLASPEFQLQ